MKTRRWITLCAVALLGLSGRTALAQLIRPRTMIVVIKFTGDRDPWAFAPQMASATVPMSTRQNPILVAGMSW